TPAWFHAGSVGVGATAPWPDSGVAVRVDQPVFDADAWDAVVREFSSPEKTLADKPLFPPIQSLQVQAGHGRLLGLDMEALRYVIAQRSPGQWQADIQSKQ